MKRFVSILLAFAFVAIITAGAFAAPTISANYLSLDYTEGAVSSVKLNDVAVPDGNMWWHTSGDAAGMIIAAPYKAALGNDEIYAWWGLSASPDVTGTKFEFTVSPDVVTALSSYKLSAVVVGCTEEATASVNQKAENIIFDAAKGTITFTTPEAVTITPKEYAIVLVAKSTSATAPTITTATLANAAVGTAYSATLAATGDTPITWTVSKGTLPAGLKLSGSTIAGTPTAAGSSTFTVTATNSAGNASKELTLKVVAAPVVQDVVSADIVGNTPAGVTGVTSGTAADNAAAKAAQEILLSGSVKIENQNIAEIPTSFIVNVSHDATASGDITLKVTLGKSITISDNLDYYVLIPTKADPSKFGEFLVDEISETSVTFTVTDFEKYFTEAPVFVAAVESETPTPSDGGSSGGCSAGLGVIALLSLIPFAFRRKK